jgi:hypothetical protein
MHTPTGSDVLLPQEISIKEALLHMLSSDEYEQISNLGLPFTWE